LAIAINTAKVLGIDARGWSIRERKEVAEEEERGSWEWNPTALGNTIGPWTTNDWQQRSWTTKKERGRWERKPNSVGKGNQRRLALQAVAIDRDNQPSILWLVRHAPVVRQCNRIIGSGGRSCHDEQTSWPTTSLGMYHLATRIHLARSRCVSHAMTSKGTSKSSSRPELAREIKALEMQPQTEALDQLKRITLEHQQESSKLTTTLYQAHRREAMVAMWDTGCYTVWHSSVGSPDSR
jgi:hypothetical protein